MPYIGTSPDTHSLETSLYFAPNSRQVVYVEPQSLNHLLPLASPNRPLLPPPLPPPPPPPRPPSPTPPPPPLLSSCLVPLAHCCCRRRRFCCSLLIIVCPCLCHCSRLCHLCRCCRLCFQHRHCRPLSDGRRHDCLPCNSCRPRCRDHFIVPVAVVNNDAMPGPCRSLRCRLLPSLLS
jgi:hypothetical protein